MSGNNAPEKFASVQFACPRCDGEHHLPGGICEKGELPTGHACCPGCEFNFDVGLDDYTAEKSVEKCAICSCEEFYIQKDFNRQLGLMVAASSLMVAFLVMVLFGHRPGLYCLFALAAVDALIYWSWKNATVCYLCHAIYRGFKPSPQHSGFYLGNEEKFKHLRIDWIERTTKQQ
tara:strand:- start:581 stop:1105 length:525 start_codon:yes stop_codon:yes gene_type:complete